MAQLSGSWERPHDGPFNFVLLGLSSLLCKVGEGGTCATLFTGLGMCEQVSHATKPRLELRDC